jgi:hypothetical protein
MPLGDNERGSLLSKRNGTNAATDKAVNEQYHHEDAPYQHVQLSFINTVRISGSLLG